MNNADSHSILYEPIRLLLEDDILVVVPPDDADDVERQEWLELSRRRLEAAYSPDEQGYPTELINQPR